MSEDTLVLHVEDIPARSAKDIFNAAGVKSGALQIQVHVAIVNTLDRALHNHGLMAALVNKLGAAITRIGGMGNPNEGGLSPEFLRDFVPQNIPDRERWKRELSF